MKLSIILVSYNTKKLLEKALHPLLKAADTEIIVVDNNSTDGSQNLVKSQFPKIKLIANHKNLGFAKANNQGIRVATGDLILLLNSDTKVYENAMENMLKYMQENKDIGIASCQLLNPDSSIQPQGGYLPNLVNIAFWMLFIDDLPLIRDFIFPYQLRNSKAFKTGIRVGWISGTAMILRRKIIKEVGLLDEKIFMYGEDIDYCLRARKRGINIAIIPGAQIVHFSHQSSMGKASAAILGEYQALKYIFNKHRSHKEYLMLRFLLKIGALLRMLVFGILQGREAYETYQEAFKVA